MRRVGQAQAGDARRPRHAIRSGSETILVDPARARTYSREPASRREFDPPIDKGKITHVVFTHAHPDHLWGTIDDFNELRFPNARYVVAEAEWNFWTDADLIRRMPEAMHGFVVGAQRNLARIKDRVKTVKGGDEIVTGVRVLDTAGHTPGHISLEVAGGDGLIVVGDVVPHTTVSFAHPGWRFGFDAIPELAPRAAQAVRPRRG